MKKQLFALAAMALTVAPAAFAATDAMSLIPTDAVTVGVVRLAEMRSSPLSSALFQQTSKITSDGDAEKFLRDAGLQPSKDVDVVVFSTSPKSNLGSEADFLVAADGRFNVERLTSALLSRGAVKKSSPNGVYFMMPEKSGDDDHPGAIAFPDGHLALIGTEGAVTEALASRAKGGTSFTGAGNLGRDMARIDPKATAFALIDVPRAQRISGAPRLHGSQSAALGMAAKNLATVALWATDNGDSLKLNALGVSSDTETLQLVEDTLRGALSAMRLAVQEKSPDLVSLLRKFTVSRSSDTVTISGSVPAETFRTWAAKANSSTR